MNYHNILWGWDGKKQSRSRHAKNLSKILLRRLRVVLKLVGLVSGAAVRTTQPIRAYPTNFGCKHDVIILVYASILTAFVQSDWLWRPVSWAIIFIDQALGYYTSVCDVYCLRFVSHVQSIMYLRIRLQRFFLINVCAHSWVVRHNRLGFANGFATERHTSYLTDVLVLSAILQHHVEESAYRSTKHFQWLFRICSIRELVYF